MELKLRELFGHDMEETGREGGEIDFSQFSDAFERSQLNTVRNICAFSFDTYVDKVVIAYGFRALHLKVYMKSLDITFSRVFITPIMTLFLSAFHELVELIFSHLNEHITVCSNNSWKIGGGFKIIREAARGSKTSSLKLILRIHSSNFP